MSDVLPRALAAAFATAALAACASRAPAPVTFAQTAPAQPQTPSVQTPAQTDASGSAGGSADSDGRVERVERNASEAVSAAGEATREGLPNAASAPLEDLNIKREEIPESLLSIDYVYTAYPPPDCNAIAREIAKLDVDLGRDYDVEEEEKKTLGERGGEAAGDLVVDTIRGVTTDVIPFRSIVREASGAAAFERRRARAFAAGYARRAYLKGLALGQGCTPPAAPRIITPPEDDQPRVEVRETRSTPANTEWGPPGPPPE